MVKKPSSQPAAAPAPVSPLELKLRYQNRLRSGASWFYWIAGLSIVNSVLMYAQSSINFVFGLAATQIIDLLALSLGESWQLAPVNTARIVGWVMNLLIVGLFVMFGVLAHRRKRWAFYVGMGLYALDALLSLFVPDRPDLLSFAFHLIVLWGLLGGLRAIARLDNLEEVLRQAGILPPQPPAIQPL